MSRDRKLICFIAICIIFLAIVLLIKIKTNSGYDYELYNEIYSEYENIFGKENKNQITNEIFAGDTNENKYSIIYENKDFTSTKGQDYTDTDTSSNNWVIGKIMIPKIDIEYPIIKETTSEYLKIAPTKYCGPEVNEVR